MSLRPKQQPAPMPTLKSYASRADAEKALDRHRQYKVEWDRRWSLGLLIGNGGGLLAVSGVILGILGDGSSGSEQAAGTAIIALLFPSCWLFISGLTIGGFRAYVAKIRSRAWELVWIRHMIHLENGERPPSRDIGQERRDGKLEVLMNLVDFASAAAFIAGVSYPMSVLAHRYFSTGAFAG